MLHLSRAGSVDSLVAALAKMLSEPLPDPTTPDWPTAWHQVQKAATNAIDPIRGVRSNLTNYGYRRNSGLRATWLAGPGNLPSPGECGIQCLFRSSSRPPGPATRMINRQQ